MGTSRVKRERARSNRPLAEHLLPPDVLRHTMDKRAQVVPWEWEAAPATEQSAALRARLDVSLLECLPAQGRLVVLGMYWGNMSQRSIARAMRCGETTVRETLARSMAHLRFLYGRPSPSPKPAPAPRAAASSATR